VLYKNIAQQLNGATEKPGKCKTIKGLENIDKIINIDQSPIGRTPRSNPATYTGAFDLIRDIFASTNEAKMRGYEKGRFSFNVPGGRCESCSVMVFTELKCIFYQMCLYLVKYVKEKDIIEKLLKLNIKERV
jgi:excinuclease UvrABC ATPase subunit